MINTLGFYKHGKKVWEQEIPERGLFYEKGFLDWLHVPRFYLKEGGCCEVLHHEVFGWYFEFSISHDEAAKIWALLFKDNPDYTFSYDAGNGGQSFTRKPEWRDSKVKIKDGKTT